MPAGTGEKHLHQKAPSLAVCTLGSDEQCISLQLYHLMAACSDNAAQDQHCFQLANLILQAEELLVSLVGLIRVVVEEGQGPISTALQEAAHHLHDQGILVCNDTTKHLTSHSCSTTPSFCDLKPG